MSTHFAKAHGVLRQVERQRVPEKETRALKEMTENVRTLSYPRTEEDSLPQNQNSTLSWANIGLKYSCIWTESSLKLDDSEKPSKKDQRQSNHGQKKMSK